MTRNTTTSSRARLGAPLALACACGLAAPASPAAAQLSEPFPAVFDLQSLRPAGGGDGSLGFVAEGGEGFDLMGFSVTSAGDINGDGIDDALLGAPGYSLEQYTYGYGYYWVYPPIAGRAYIIFGRDSSTGAGFPASLDVGALVAGDGVVLEGDLNDYAGSAVAALGDFNGDGVDDVAVGAPRDGRAYVVFGRDSGGGAGLPLNISLTALDGADGFRLFGQSHEGIGSAVGSADLNGDGLGDLLIGACCVQVGGRIGAGEVLVHFGRAAASFPIAASVHAVDGVNGFRIVGVETRDFTGGSVARAGDVNGDGVEDIIIGANGAEPGGLNDAGSSFVVFGRAGGGFGAQFDLAGLDGLNGFRLNGGRERDKSGQSVASAGDLNGDGIDDIVIGAPQSGLSTQPGRAYVVFGRDSAIGETFPATIELADLDGVTGFRIEGVTSRDLLGEHVAPAGDVNGDGIDDLLVAGPGSAFIVYGRDTTSGPGFPAVLELADLDGSDGFTLTGAGAMWGVGGAGDLNRDGASDFIIGSPHYGVPGKSYIVFGRTPDAPCYADCDGSGSLDFFDFLCFQNQFAAGDPQADCDDSGELDFFDFLCFQNAFAAGCE